MATAVDAINGATKPRKRKVGWMDWFLESTPVGRGILFDKARGRGRGRVRARVRVWAAYSPRAARWR